MQYVRLGSIRLATKKRTTTTATATHATTHLLPPIKSNSIHKYTNMSRRSRAKALPKPPAQEFPDDEEIGDDEAEDLDEEQEITRCVCGNDELVPLQINPSLQSLLLTEYQIKVDLGLFIQCDKCSAWQHGYCVGLFINEDVPDKYWCEQCRPELHIVVADISRTLYKPVNEKRKVLINWSNDASHGKRRAGKTRTSASPTEATGNDDSGEGPELHQYTSKHRKERRHFESGSYDEELEKALRESAKESGVPLSDIESRGSRKRRGIKEEDDKSSAGSSSPTKRKRQLQSDEDGNKAEVKISIERATADAEDEDNEDEQAEADDHPEDEGQSAQDDGDEASAGEEGPDDGEEGAELPLRAERLAKSTSKAIKAASKASNKVGDKDKTSAGAGAGSGPGSGSGSSTGATTSPTTITATSTTTSKKKPGRGKNKATTTTTTVTSKITAPSLSKEELINQASKPRFVNSKSSIYELRKRTGAILEWLGRSQLELEEEKSSKVELFLYHEGDKNDQQKVITNSYDTNLKLMEQLTEKILNWEQKFGKYGP